MQQSEYLVDPFGRSINYLRLSLTDRCNFRCVYCMAEKMTFLPKSALLSFEEIIAISRVFCELGISKIRLTGGEPLIRQHIVKLCEKLKAIPGLNELVMTTNGAKLAQYAGDLKSAGVERLNISLDTLDTKKFRQITRTGELSDVLAGIDAALTAGFKRTKINAVILKGFNEEEVLTLLDFVLQQGIDISFIEEMPLGHISSHERAQSFFSTADVKREILKKYSLAPSLESSGGPSRYFSVPGFSSRIGFISPHSNNFCSTCNRVRLSAQGKLYLCLGNNEAVDLKTFVREHPNQPGALKQHIQEALRLKPEKHHFKHDGQVEIVRFMNMTGG